jgi:acyl carrier protein
VEAALMEEPELYTALVGICRQVLNAPELEIRDEHTAAEIPGYDSLAHIEILVRSQQTFGVKLTALEAGQIANFGELKSLIRRQLAAAG